MLYLQYSSIFVNLISSHHPPLIFYSTFNTVLSVLIFIINTYLYNHLLIKVILLRLLTHFYNT